MRAGSATPPTVSARAGYPGSGAIAATQARLVGSMQQPMVESNFAVAAAALRDLAPTYDKLRAALVSG